MPAPAAPRKKGVLTSSTSSSTRRAGIVKGGSTPAANAIIEEKDGDNLAAQLSKVTLDSSKILKNASSAPSRVSKAVRLPSATPKAAPKQIPLELVAAASASINTILKTFSDKHLEKATPTTLRTLFSDASAALHTLRANREFVEPGKRIEIEKAALVLVGYCNDYKLHDLALQQLTETRSSLIGLYAPFPADSPDELASSLQSFSLDTKKGFRTSPNAIKTKVHIKATSAESGLQAIKRALALLSLPLPATTEKTSPSHQDVFDCLLILCHHALSCALSLPVASPAEEKKRFSELTTLFLPVQPAVNGIAIGPLAIAQAARAREVSELKKLDSTLSGIYTLLVKHVQEQDIASLADPINVLQCKCYAIECLLQNETYFVQASLEAEESVNAEKGEFVRDKSLELLSFQLHRAFVQFGKTSVTQNGVAETALASLLREHAMQVLTRAIKVVHPQERWLRCKAAMDMIEFLGQVARKGANEVLLDVIAQMLSASGDSGPGQTTQIAEMLDYATDADMKREMIRICSRLNAETGKLDKWIKDENQLTLFLPDTILRCLGVVMRLLHHRTSLSPESSEILSKTIDRLLYYPCRALRKELVNSASISGTLELIVLSVAQEVELVPWLSASLNTVVIDVLSHSARQTLIIGSPPSYKMAYILLERAQKLAPHVDIDKRIEKIGCLASTAYRLGALLYNDDKAANAIPFLKLACDLGSLISERPNKNGINGCSGVLSDERSRNLNAQMPQRYELLGLAYATIKDKREALEAYQQALVASVVQLQINGQSPDLFEKDTAFIKILTRYTKLAIFDLLLSPKLVSIAFVLSEANLNPKESIKAMLLECQIKILDPYLEKSLAVDAVKDWLEQAECSLEQANMPYRLARLLLRQMESLARGHVNCHADVSLGTLALRIAGLMSSTPPHSTDDYALARYSNQYTALSRIWLALDAVRRKDTAASKLLAKEGKEALHLLRSLLDISIMKGGLSARSDRRISLEDIEGRRRLASTGSHVRGMQTGQPKLCRKTGDPSVKNIIRSHTNNNTPKMRKPLSPKSASKATENGKHRITPPRQMTKSPSTALNNNVSPTAKHCLATCILDEPGRTTIAIGVLTSVLGVFEHTFLRLGYLRLSRRLFENTSNQDYVIATVQLAHEYLHLGKTSRAASVLEQAKDRLECEDVSVQTKIHFRLGQAKVQSQRGQREARCSLSSYLSALEMSEKEDQLESGGNTEQRIITRTQLLRRTALAAETFSRIQYQRDKPSQSLSAALQAFRLVNRAMANMSRLYLSKQSYSTGTFDDDKDSAEAQNAQASHKASATIQSLGTGSLGWDAATTLASLLLWISQLYAIRGSVRSAAFFLQKALEFSEDLNAPRLKAKVIASQVDLSISLKDYDAVRSNMDSLRTIAVEEGGISTIEIMRFKAHLSTQNLDHGDAEETYISAHKAIEKLNKGFADMELFLSSPPKQVRPEQVLEGILPLLQNQILRSHIWLLSRSDRENESQPLLQRLAVLAQLGHEKAEEAALQAKIMLFHRMADLRKDPVMGLLQESVLSVPMLGSVSSALPANRRDAAILLEEIEILLTGTAALNPTRSSTRQWRDICSTVAHLRICQSTIGQVSKTKAAAGVAAALEAGTAINLKREMLDILTNRLAGMNRNDLEWPNTSNLSASCDDTMADYWSAVLSRYTADIGPGRLRNNQLAASLPQGWAALTLHISTDRQSILAVRYIHKCEPFVLQLPLDRLGRRESEDNLLTFEAALEELSSIIEASNHTSQSAKDVQDREGRIAWWRTRKDLEARLQELLEGIEARWLGAFRSVLTGAAIGGPAENSRNALVPQLDRVLRKAILTTKDNRNLVIKLDNSVVQCFTSLDKACSDDDLEDLLHFVVDSYQFCGIHVACDEIDVDQAVVDLRTLLDEYHLGVSQQIAHEDDHLFLILDKDLHSFPWESLPCLNGRSTSRLPALTFLQDRLELRKHRLGNTFSSFPGSVVDATKTFYTLNPDGDLKHTQNEFEPWLLKHGWKGICGRAPMEEELKRGLADNDLFLYFGHGGAEQYIRSQTVRNLPRCATSLLWGCSSGHLREQGEFEATGTPWTYMLAGSPAVVANLWDVTDKDIDRFTKATLEGFGLGDTPSNLTLSAAVANARGSCSLRYLNGAAPVVWGIPVKLKA